MAILVTGGAGYIGSHTVVELLNAGKEVVVLDNLCNSSPKSLERVKQITGKEAKFYEGDILDRALLQKIFAENEINSVIHFAGLKAVGESVQKPTEYYMNNVAGTLVLIQEMKKRVFGTLYLAHLQRFTAIQKLFQLQRIVRSAVQPILMVHLNIWLSRFYAIQQKRNQNLA